jgi:hypothetical protein
VDGSNVDDCNIIESPGPPMRVYVVHSPSPSGDVTANTSQFKIENNWAAFPGAVDFGPNLFIPSTAFPGDIYGGGTVTYVGCEPLPHLIATLDFFFGGVFEPPCERVLEVVPDPILASGQIEVVDCDGVTIHYATGGTLYANGVNPSEECPCFIGPGGTDWAAIRALLGTCDVDTEETGWGRVKALYR